MYIKNLPKPVVKRVGEFYVVRDDLLPGGTKQRYIEPLLNTLPYDEFVYASPAYGWAQLALAISAKSVGKKATIFTAQRKNPHPMTVKTAEAGANVIMIPHGYLSNIQHKAKLYTKNMGAYYVPFGTDSQHAIDTLAQEALRIDFTPHEVWCVSGSGTLTRGLQKAWPNAKHYAVVIGANPDTGNAIRLVAPEKYEQDSKLYPPYPSSANYDAKLWQFVTKMATPNALIWNVAK